MELKKIFGGSKQMVIGDVVHGESYKVKAVHNWRTGVVRVGIYQVGSFTQWLFKVSDEQTLDHVKDCLSRRLDSSAKIEIKNTYQLMRV